MLCALDGHAACIINSTFRSGMGTANIYASVGINGGLQGHSLGITPFLSAQVDSKGRT